MIIDALPKMVEAANSSDLKMSLQQHLDVTRQQAQRLEQVFSSIDERPSRKKCVGMEGIIKEGEQHMKELMKDQDALDAGLIASAQKVEHYEIATYGTAKTYAAYSASRMLLLCSTEHCQRNTLPTSA